MILPAHVMWAIIIYCLQYDVLKVSPDEVVERILSLINDGFHHGNIYIIVYKSLVMLSVTRAVISAGRS